MNNLKEKIKELPGGQYSPVIQIDHEYYWQKEAGYNWFEKYMIIYNQVQLHRTVLRKGLSVFDSPFLLYNQQKFIFFQGFFEGDYPGILWESFRYTV